MDANKSSSAKTDTFLRQLVQIPSLLGGILILMSALVIIYDVVTRAFGASTFWADEMTGYFLVVTAFLGGGFALQSGKHVQVTFVLERLSASINKFLDKLVKVLILLISFCLLYFGIMTVIDLYESHFVSTTMLSFPLAIPYAAIPVGALFIIVEVIREVLDFSRNKGGK